MAITEKTSDTDELMVAGALAESPETLPDAIRQWRVLKDHVDAIAKTVADHTSKITWLKNYIQHQLDIPEGQDKSETVSVPGAGSASKKTQVVAEVVDWEAWQKYCVRNGFGAVNRHQNNIAPLQDLYEGIMTGEFPMPKSANFKTIEKISLRRN